MKLLRKEKEKDFFAFSEQNYFWSQFKSELRESMKTQKEEIEVLEKQKESTQGLACELERQNENQNDEIERTEVREKAAEEKSNFFTLEKQITKVGTMIRSLDKNNQKLSKKIPRFARQRQEEQR